MSGEEDPTTTEQPDVPRERPAPRESHTPPEPVADVELRQLMIEAGGQTLLSEPLATIPGGRITVIVGGSGAGKSVLLRVLAGLLPSQGEAIRWSGTVGHPGGEPLQGVGIVFQQFALFDELTPTANVQFAIDHRRRPERPPVRSAKAWLGELRIPSDVPVSALSGGQQQRLAIARTLAAAPEVILYDEPTSGLDAATGQQVAALIRHTQRLHGRTSLVVTHDYATLLPIADHLLLLDTAQRRLVEVPPGEWGEIAQRMPGGAPAPEKPAPSAAASPGPAGGSARLALLAGDSLEVSGRAVIAALRLPRDLLPWWPQTRWGLRFVAHYLRLVCGPSAWLYMMMAGAIIGFTSTYFTFKFLPFQLYTKPLLMEDLIAAIGFALYRVLVPVLATVLIAARCGAAVAADVGVKRYGAQVEALQTLGVRPESYLLTPILIAFLVGTPVLEWICFQAAQAISLWTFTATHPELGPYFWELHFSQQLEDPRRWGWVGSRWLLVKTMACGIGIAAISYYRGLRPKASARDVSDAITSTVLWVTLYVLVVHFLVAFYEF